MKQLIRFSISGLFGFIITAALFVGMLSLLNSQKTQIQTTDANINFSFVKDYKKPEVEPSKTIKKPEQQEVTQAPAMPNMNLETSSDPGPNIQMPNTAGKNLNILQEEKMSDAGLGSGVIGDKSGGIQSAIAPMYPQKELIAKNEGWVKVLIDVNEFGRVSSVSILQSKPARVFNAATIKAVKKWRFHPKEVDGKAIPYQVTQTVEFKIDQ